MKDAERSFTLSKQYLEMLWLRAARQSKQAVLVVTFGDLTATVTLDMKGKT